MPIQIQFEWEDPAGARGPELRATWARLQIEIAGSVTTRAIDSRTNGVRDGIYLPLYPLAEWFVTNWWFLLGEVEGRDRLTQEVYCSRHGLRSAGEGFALPDIEIVSTGQRIELSWNPTALVTQGISFTEQGRTTIDAGEFTEAIGGFIRAVIERLHSYDIRDTLLEAEFAAIQAADDEERQFCTAAAALGIDPYSTDEGTIASIESAAAAIPESTHPEFFASTAFAHILEQSQEIAASLSTLQTTATTLAGLKDLCFTLEGRTYAEKPWRHGYRLARQLRATLGAGDVGINSFESLAGVLRMSEAQLLAGVLPILASASRVDAIVASDAIAGPAFAIPERSQPGKMFALCRALCQFLIAPLGSAQLVTRSRSEAQKRNRAFAAEFLMPEQFLKQRITQSVIFGERIDEIAEELQASPYVVRHQIRNHGLAHIVD